MPDVAAGLESCGQARRPVRPPAGPPGIFGSWRGRCWYATAVGPGSCRLHAIVGSPSGSAERQPVPQPGPATGQAARKLRLLAAAAAFSRRPSARSPAVTRSAGRGERVAVCHAKVTAVSGTRPRACAGRGQPGTPDTASPPVSRGLALEVGGPLSGDCFGQMREARKHCYSSGPDLFVRSTP
jgi:hypothetical protein